MDADQGFREGRYGSRFQRQRRILVTPIFH